MAIAESDLLIVKTKWSDRLGPIFNNGNPRWLAATREGSDAFSVEPYASHDTNR